MKTIGEFLHQLRGMGIKLWTENGELCFQAPKGALTPETASQLRKRKPEILAFFQQAVQRSEPDQPPITPAPADAVIPLSFSQQRLWFLDQLEDEDNTAYNIVLSLKLMGDLDMPALAASVSHIRERHSVLRTTFPLIEGTPVQAVNPDPTCKLHIIDLVRFPNLEAGAKSISPLLRRHIAQVVRKPYDLVNGPLFRITLLRTQPNAHILLMTMHHIVSDGWSMGVLNKELIQLYEAFVNNREPGLPPLPIQYSDFSWWQHQHVGDAGIKRQLDFWRNTLSGAPGLHQLPTDYPRPPHKTFNGDLTPFVLRDETVVQTLRELCRRTGASMFMCLHAAFSVFLAKYSGQDDVVVGTPIANRSRRELEPLVGFFVNTLVLRADLSQDEISFARLLENMRQQTLAAFSNQDVPFEQVVDIIKPERSLSYTPLFQIMFSLHNTPNETRGVTISGLELMPVQLVSAGTKFDLTLSMRESEQGLSGGLDYNTDLFKPTTINRMIDHFCNLLKAIAADPDQSIRDLSLMGEGEYTRLLDDWNNTASPLSGPQILHQRIAAQARQTPDANAVYAPCPSLPGAPYIHLTHAELNRRADQLAHQLRGLGVQTDSIVGVYCERSVEMVIALLGIQKAGAAYLPLDPEHPRERQEFILQDAQVALAVTQPGLQLENIQTIVPTLDADDPPKIDLPMDPANAAYVIYTSGSTGKPKGAVNTHAAICNRLIWMQEAYQLSPADRVLQKTTYTFDVSVWEFFWPLLTGAALIAAKPGGHGDPRYLAGLIAQRRITTLHFVPSMLSAFLDSAEPAEGSSLKRAICSGEALTRQQCTRFFAWNPKAELHNLYGPTEAAIDVTFQPCLPQDDDPRVPIGKPIANITTHVLDRHGRPATLGACGELCIGGIGLARGYFRRPALTAEKFIPNPFDDGERLYRTGDLVRYRDNGVIDFMGRIDHQIKLRGFRIELGEIEAALNQAPGVQDALVLLRNDRPGEGYLVGYVRLDGDVDLSDPSLLDPIRAHLTVKLPAYMVPAAIVPLHEFPMLPNGKIDRKALPAPEAVETGTGYRAPRDETETALCHMFSEILGLDQVGAEADFFALGGNSLLATRIITRVHKRFALDLPLRAVFEAPTAAALAARIKRDRQEKINSGRPDLEPVSRDQKLPLSYAQLRLWFLAQLEPHDTSYNIPMSLRFDGPLATQAFAKALAAISLRHEGLCTLFVAEGDEPLLNIADAPIADLHLYDFQDLPEDVRENTARALAGKHARYIFNLASGPLLHIALIRLAPQNHVLLINMHHIITDGWSAGIFQTEILKLYEQALLEPEAEPIQLAFTLPALTIQYADFAHWQRGWLTGEVLEAKLDFWRHQLGDAPPLLELPLDQPRPKLQTHRGAAAPFRLDAQLTTALNTLSRNHNTTLFMTLLAGLQLLLHRYSGQDHIAVGTPVANRGQAEIEPLIGFFVNTLVLKGSFTHGGEKFDRFLARLRDTSLDAFNHQDVPFEKVVDAINPERSLNHSPLFQVMFVFQNTPEAEARPISGLTPRPMQGGGHPGIKYDLMLVMREGGHGIAGNLDYNVDLFQAETAARMCNHLQGLFTAIATDPTRAVADLPILTAEERERVLVEWNATAVPRAGEQILHRLFEAQAARTPQATATIGHHFSDGQLSPEMENLTYAELNNRANRLAQQLADHGVGSESIVAVICERSLEMVTALLGIQKAGAAYLPIDPGAPPQRTLDMLADSHAAAVVSQPGLTPPEGRPLISLKAESPAENIADPTPPLQPENAAYVIYTSGSTGKPKGAVNSHRAICNRLLWGQETYPLEANDRLLQKTPYTFDVSVWEFFWPLTTGSTLVLAKPGGHQDPLYLADLIALRRITIMHFVPSMLAAFLETADPAKTVGLRRVICSGEALPTPLRKRFFQTHHLELLNFYGPTEAAVEVSFHACGDEGAGLFEPIGKPIANTALYVLDRYHQPAPIGAGGELHIGGLNLARGYFARPDLTAERFIPNAFSQKPGQRLYRTGDLVRFRADGTIDFMGRIDHQIKLRGFRIELGEIEATLASHPAIHEAAVILRETRPGDQRLLAFYTVAAVAAKPGETELRDHLGRHLPAYMLPNNLIPLDAMPLSPNGKLDRKALAQIEISAEKESGGYSGQPKGAVERKIAAIWKALLQVENVGARDNFFDLGGHSLLLIQAYRQLHEAFPEAPLEITHLFQYPTVNALATFIRGGENEEPEQESARHFQPSLEETDIAVIGMALRFPGADTPEGFWANLRDGVESIRFYSQQELIDAGLPAAMVQRPDFVPASCTIPDVDQFDAAFFGINPKEAEVTDPQQRIFLEEAWHALEHAGYDPQRFPGQIGVYAGVGVNTYLWEHLVHSADLLAGSGIMQVMIGNDKDYLASRVAYRLNLNGPGFTIQSACSTSLVAIHNARHGLLMGDCDMALAGGVSVTTQANKGYIYQEGNILSPDGHCRAFDAQAGGTMAGSGVGILVLKRLADAKADGDTIHGIIKGSAINNDGSARVGFTAPSVDGQAAVIEKALANAGVPSESISYIETHGTGTSLGDPIEIAALNKAFRHDPRPRNSVPIGSVKTNFGHLDAAAGAAGLIKTLLAMRHQAIPPSLHFERPNPKIDFNGPFRVNAQLSEWPALGQPRRAGVSSFGIGGTNAHLIVEEPPVQVESEPAGAIQLLTLSAQNEDALEAMTANLADHLEQHPELNLADIAFTLQYGRRAFNHRRVVVCQNREQAIELLRRPAKGVFTRKCGNTQPSVVFLFPGQGAQYVGMAAGVYQHEPVFKQWLDTCADLLEPHLKLDLRQLLFPAEDQAERAAERLNRTDIAQAALFAVEYATAQLLLARGLRPEAMLGHSLGEYAAACLAGVFSLEDALSLVAVRGSLMASLPEGDMLAVSLPEKALAGYLDDTISLAVRNAPGRCVVSGPKPAIAALQQELESAQIVCRLLVTSHAFHSAMMDSILPAFTQRLQQVSFKPPKLPFISNVSGTWITDEQATDPNYWAQHLRGTVRFADGVTCLLKETNRLFIEVGPGHNLTASVRQNPAYQSEVPLINCLPHPNEKHDDVVHYHTALGKLWLAGLEPAWAAMQPNRRRVPLPTYPFQRKRFWPEKTAAQRPSGDRALAGGKQADLTDWFYTPAWRETSLAFNKGEAQQANGPYLLFLDECGLGLRLVEGLEQMGLQVFTVTVGETFRELNETAFTIDPRAPKDCEKLFDALRKRQALPGTIIHAWSVTEAGDEEPLERAGRLLDLGFYAMVNLAQALGRLQGEAPQIIALANHMFEINGTPAAHPEKATLMGPCKVIPQEYPECDCRLIDVPMNGDGPVPARLVKQLLAEITNRSKEEILAYRGNRRLVLDYTPQRLEPVEATASVKRGGVYLITGGLGGIGLTFANWLAKHQTKLVLTGRSALPPRDQWDTLIAAEPASKTAKRISAVKALEAQGAEVMVAAADVTAPQSMGEALSAARGKLGPINGVIHTAGLPSGGVMQLKSREKMAPILAPKVQGTLVLDRLLRENEALDFLVLCSSMNGITGGFGQADYCSANAFMDAYANSAAASGTMPAISINWDAWLEVGMAAEAAAGGRNIGSAAKGGHEQKHQAGAFIGLTPEEGCDALARLLAHGLSQCAVSVRDMRAVAHHMAEERRRRRQVNEPAETPRAEKAKHARPELDNPYIAPRSQMEQRLAAIWSECLGIGEIGIEDNFFELGGDSLLAVQIVARVRQALQIDLSMAGLFDEPTILGLAELIEAVSGGGDSNEEDQEDRERGTI